MTSISEYAFYVQLVIGSIEQTDLSEDLKTGFCFQVARTANVGREYFFKKIEGVKLLCEIPGIIENGFIWWWGMHPVAPQFIIVRNVAETAKRLITVSEVYTKLKGVFNWSVWTCDEVSWAECILKKGGEVADWTMSVVKTYRWFATIGFIASRAWMDTVGNVASIVSIIHGAKMDIHNAKMEAAKWWTGKIIDPLKGDMKDFEGVDKIKSIFMCCIIASYAGLTAITFAQMAGIAVAHVDFLNFALFTSGVTSTIGAHFWEELMVKKTS